MVYKKKLKWSGVGYLLEGLRIDEDKLYKLNTQDFNDVLQAHKSRRVIKYLHHLQKELEK